MAAKRELIGNGINRRYVGRAAKVMVKAVQGTRGIDKPPASRR